MHPVATRARAALVWRVLSLVAVALLPSGPAYAGVLETVRSEVRDSSDDDDDDDDDRSKRRRDCDYDSSPCSCGQSDCDCCDDDSGTEHGLGELVAHFVLSPFWAPMGLLSDDRNLPGRFAEYPYSPDTEGSMLIGRLGSTDLKPWSGRFLAEYGTDFRNLERVGGRLLLSTEIRLDLDTECNWLTEDTASGQDQLWLGDFNIVYRFAQNEHVQFRSGVGFNWLGDGARADFGFNFTYGADFYPVDPLVFSALLDWGKLGDATLFHIRATAGVTWHGIEVFTGYDYRTIGDATIQGLIAGTQVYF